MHTNRYWALQEAALERACITDRINAGDDEDKVFAALLPSLAELTEADLKATFADYCQLLVRAYSAQLWAAAYLIGSGQSDDGFDFFCEWLILQGPAVYEAAVTNPDSLAEYLADPSAVFIEFEGLMGAFFEVAEQKGMDGDTCFDGLMQPYPAIDLGWADDPSQLAALFPRLAAKINA